MLTGDRGKPRHPCPQETEVSPQGEQPLSPDLRKSTAQGFYCFHPGNRTRTSCKTGVCAPLGHSRSLTPRSLIIFLVSVCVYDGRGHMPHWARGGQRTTLWNPFSPSVFTQVLGITLRSPGLQSKHLPHGASSQAATPLHLHL